MLDDYDFAQFDGMPVDEIFRRIIYDDRFLDIYKILVETGIINEGDFDECLTSFYMTCFKG